VPVGVQPAGAADATEQNVDLRAGAVYSLAVLDAPGSGIKVVPLLDAAGAGKTPGSVNAGYGGAAADSRPRGGGGPAALAVSGLLLGAGVLIGATVRRRRA
jgi:hypothetical protein